MTNDEFMKEYGMSKDFYIEHSDMNRLYIVMEMLKREIEVNKTPKQFAYDLLDMFYKEIEDEIASNQFKEESKADKKLMYIVFRPLDDMRTGNIYLINGELMEKMCDLKTYIPYTKEENL